MAHISVKEYIVLKYTPYIPIYTMLPCNSILSWWYVIQETWTMICFSIMISKPGCYYFRFFPPLYDTYYHYQNILCHYYVPFLLQFLDYYFILCQILENSYYFTYFNTIIFCLHYSFQLYQLKHCFDTYFNQMYCVTYFFWRVLYFYNFLFLLCQLL